MVKEIYRRVTPEIILEKIGDYFNIPNGDLKKKKRSKTLAFPRQIAMYLIRELSEMSLSEIGGFFSAKHHTTILYACKKIRNDLKTDKKLQLIIDILTREIKNL